MTVYCTNFNVIDIITDNCYSMMCGLIELLLILTFGADASENTV